MSLLYYPLFLLYKLLNMFQATKCPSPGADDCLVLYPRVGIVPWLQEGCQKRLASSASTEEFVALNSSVDTRVGLCMFNRRCIYKTNYLSDLKQIYSKLQGYNEGK